MSTCSTVRGTAELNIHSSNLDDRLLSIPQRAKNEWEAGVAPTLLYPVGSVAKTSRQETKASTACLSAEYSRAC